MATSASANCPRSWHVFDHCISHNIKSCAFKSTFRHMIKGVNVIRGYQVVTNTRVHHGSLSPTAPDWNKPGFLFNHYTCTIGTCKNGVVKLKFLALDKHYIRSRNTWIMTKQYDNVKKMWHAWNKCVLIVLQKFHIVLYKKYNWLDPRPSMSFDEIIILLACVRNVGSEINIPDIGFLKTIFR